MKKYLWQKKVVLLFSVLLFFVMGYFICSYLINNNTKKFLLNVSVETYDETINDDNIRFALENVKNSKTGERLITDKNISKLMKKNNLLIEKSEAGFIISIKEKYLNYNESRAKKFVNNLFPNSTINNIKEIDYFNPYIFGSIFMAFGAVIALLFLLIQFRISKDDLDIIDNENIFSSIFHKKYWILACNKNIKIKDLCIIAILFAMMMLSKAIKLPSGFTSMGITATYLFFATICWLYGPIVGLIIGFFSDVLGFFLFPNGFGFYFPYTLNAMLSGFIYGIFFYKKRITFSAIFFARVLINILINVILGSIWWMNINNLTIEQAKIYLLFTSLPKNLVYLFPQSVALYIVFKALGRVFMASNIVDAKICKNISII